MLPVDYMLAVVLLTAAPGSAEPENQAALFQSLRLPLQRVAIGWEILDPREVRYILARAEDFIPDLNLLRRRHQELIHAPAVNECYRFPDRATINDLLAFNRAYRQQLDSRQPVDLVNSSELRQALQETEQLYQIWDNVRDARCDYYYVTVRRHALKRLRELAGEEAYYSGNLPPCVPLWRFRQAD
jgi:hypothetical protein